MTVFQERLIPNCDKFVKVKEPTAFMFPWRLYAEFTGERFLLAFSDNEEEINRILTEILSQ